MRRRKLVVEKIISIKSEEGLVGDYGRDVEENQRLPHYKACLCTRLLLTDLSFVRSSGRDVFEVKHRKAFTRLF